MPQDAGLGTDSGAGLVNDVAPVTQDTTPVGSEQAPTGENPAWAEVLGVLPDSLHSTVKPYLEKWDKGVNERFSKVQSQYDPYKDFLSVDPQQINASLQLAQLVATDPRAFYDRMTQHYGSEWGLAAGQGQQDASTNADDYSLDGLEEDNGQDLSKNPLIQQLKEQQDTIASFLASQVEAQQQQQYQAEVEAASKQIDTEFTQVAGKFGFDAVPDQAAKMIISLCAANEGLTITQAAEEVMPLFAAQNKPSPRILAPGGGVPANNLDPAKMGPTDTRAMVAQMLAQANSQR